MEDLKLLKKELIAANKGAATNFKVSQILLTENTKLKAELLILQDRYNESERIRILAQKRIDELCKLCDKQEQVDNSIIAIDKAIMHLTALGINNTTYLLEVKKTLKDLLRQALNTEVTISIDDMPSQNHAYNCGCSVFTGCNCKKAQKD